MKKTILIFLLLIPFVFAESKDESFTIPVEVKLGNWYVNVTVGDSTNSYSCNSSSTNTFTPTIHHNFTYECDTDVKNFTDSVNILADNCRVIQEAYKDSSTYYKQYVDCKTSLATCESKRDTFQKDANEKNKAVSDKDRINKELTETIRESGEFEILYKHANSTLSICEITSSGYSGQRWLMFFIGVGIGVGGLYLINKQRETKSPVHKDMPK